VSGFDAGLNAGNDPMWIHAVLTARQIHLATLRTLAEAWAERREDAIDEMDTLAASLNRVEGGWDAAVCDLEANLQLDEADVMELTAEQARRLAEQLLAAADRTAASRREAERPLMFQHQKDRRAA